MRKVRQCRLDTSHKIMIEKSELNGGFLTPLHYHHRSRLSFHRKTSSLIYKTSKHNEIRNIMRQHRRNSPLFVFDFSLYLSVFFSHKMHFDVIPLPSHKASLPHFMSSQHMHENCVVLPLMLFN